MAGAMTAKHADTLLDLLASDAEFRKAFEADSEKALKSKGIPHEAARCCRKRLPSKKVFQESRAALRSQLMGKLEMNVFKL